KALKAPAGQVWERISVDRGAAQFDVTMMVLEDGPALDIELEYSTDLFSEETMERMLGHYTTMLEAAVQDADVPLSRLPLLTAEERAKVLTAWNDTDKPYDRNLSLHELFERRAQERPQAIAIRFEDERLSYGELERRANQLA